MKSSDLGKSTSNPTDETQMGNRAKRRRNSKPRFTSIQSSLLNNQPSKKSPITFPSKFTYRRFNTLKGEKKFSTLKGSLLTGEPVNFEGFYDLSKCFEENNLAVLFNFERTDFYFGLIGEFYCNLVTKVDSGDNLELLSTVNGQNIVLNELLICRALNLPSRMLDYAKIDSKSFSFSLAEFHQLLENLSGNTVPTGQFQSEMLISVEFLFPSAQFLAFILRTNLLPRFGSEKLFCFAELKIIYHLLKRDLQLNIPHLILSHISSSNKVNAMVFGILLTTIFNYLKIPLNEHSFTTINSVIHGKGIKPPIPLSDSMLINSTSVDKSVKKIVVDESVQKLINQLEVVFEKKNQDLREMVEALDKKIESLKTETDTNASQSLENNSLIVTTLGDIQSKLYMLEQFYLSASGNEDSQPQNLNSDLNRLHKLAGECEMMDHNDRKIISIGGETGQTSQLLGSTSSIDPEHQAIQFDPPSFP